MLAICLWKNYVYFHIFVSFVILYFCLFALNENDWVVWHVSKFHFPIQMKKTKSGMINYDMPFSNFITAKCPKRKRKMLKNICFFKYFTLQSGMIKYDMPFFYILFYYVFFFLRYTTFVTVELQAAERHIRFVQTKIWNSKETYDFVFFFILRLS